MGFVVIDSAGRVKQAATVPQVVYTFSTTGTVHDLDFGNADVIEWTGAADLTLDGLLAGYDGQVVEILNYGTANILLPHQTGSTAANQLTNVVTSGATPLAAGKGSGRYRYKAATSKWVLVSHAQGVVIQQAYNAGDFTANAGSWTVDSGDVLNFGYLLVGNVLFVFGTFNSTTVTATPDTLKFAIPGGFSGAKQTVIFYRLVNNGVDTTGLAFNDAPGTNVNCQKFGGGALATATNNTFVQIVISMSVT